MGAFGVVNNRSVAAYVAADKVAFYHCAFYSRFNTLFDSKGRHYYDNCYITGSIDFIFGRARSIFNVSQLSIFILFQLLNRYKLIGLRSNL